MSLHDILPSQDLTAELRRPVEPSASDGWYDVEAGCYLDEGLPHSFDEEEGAAAAIPAQDSPCSPGSSHGSSPYQIDEHNIDGHARSASEELAVSLKP